MHQEPGKRLYLSEQSTTHWGTVFEAQDAQRSTRDAALQRFIDRYRTPIELEIRHFASWADREVEDLTSGFKLHLLEKLPSLQLSPEKGCFRDWLKRCIKNFLVENYRHRRAGKRGGGAEHLSTDATSDEGGPLLDLPDHVASQDRNFDRAWAHHVVRLGVAALEQECIASRKGTLFQELKPSLTGADVSSGYAAIASRLGTTEGAIKAAAKRLRDRLGELIREEVRSSVGSKADVNDEIRFLMSLL